VSFRRRIDAAELLDGPLLAGAELAGNLRDLDRVNGWLGGHWLVFEAVSALVTADASMPITILDVGAGGGGGLRSTLRRLGLSGHPCRGIMLDKSGAVLEIARRRPLPSAGLVRGDAIDLPMATRGVDIAQCSLMLHHLAPPVAVRALREMSRVSRLGIVIDDLLRGSLGYAGALLLSRLATRNRLTRHDAPLSVRRAYTMAELLGLLIRANLRPVWGAHIPGYRAVLAACP